MDDWLSYVIFFVGSGLAFFVGTACMLVGLASSFGTLGRVRSIVRNLAVLLGGIFVIVSAAPLEWWLYGLVAAVTCVWLPLEWWKVSLPKSVISSARAALATAWLLALALELPYHVTPTLPPLDNPTFCLIGDSVSAGMSDTDRRTWPTLLARQRPIEVYDCSKMGATVKSARKQAASLGDRTGLVLLEIGGNDLLGTTSAAEFEMNLDLLLSDVCRPDRTVVMLGLPLPPLSNQFGLDQRRLARKYNVILLPQRIFAGLLTAPGATVDGIHLTAEGHQRMADTVWDLIRSVYD